jgi:G:T/U-mismatch repair DNA glycosylase
MAGRHCHKTKGLKALSDYLIPGLEIVSIGLNPSLSPVRVGFYFANPRNRFWRALCGGLAVMLRAAVDKR